ncbi:MAG: radical SAM protein [Parcubacteria group bacterium Athens0714_26]|nr:MAG: radical SAM protein [Parcubacteria group bacterium Athens1014_26]TSD02955.1 MAG: radical SAM protein [Parcubacteria group bacterium Athens0714_26]
MESLIKLNNKIGWRLIGNEIVAFNCATQEVAVFNETAAVLWPLLARGITLHDLASELLKKFGLSYMQAWHDSNVFLGELAEQHYLDDELRCIPMKTESGVVQSDGQQALLSIEMKAIELLIPFAVTFEVTYSCNENCIHCYMEHNLPSLKLHDIRHILEQLSKAGTLFVSFTGGEFFTRPDALSIIKYADELHFTIDILSNGTLITDDVAKELSIRKVRRVQVSLYGATAQTHDSVTNLSGSFNQTIVGIRRLRECGIKVEIAYPMLQHTFHERYRVRELIQSLGCIMSPSPVITPRNNGRLDTLELRITNEQLEDFLANRELSETYAGRPPFEEHKLYFGFSNLLEAAPCYSGFNTCAITPVGKVLPCNQFLVEVGDLHKQTFKQIWRNSSQLQFLRNIKISNLSCATCSLLHLCARCPGLALLEGGSMFGNSPENCRIAQVRNKLRRKEEAI